MIWAMSAPHNAVPDPTPARPIPESYWVVPGRFLAGEHPGSASRALAMERLKRFLASGVSCFIDLTDPEEAPPYEAYLPFATPDGRRIAYLREPIVDHDVPAGRETMTRILRMIDDALAAGHVVYLHCRAGVGRSSMVVGCWLAERSATAADALMALQDLWRQSARSRAWSAVPETDEQVEYVRTWRSTAPPAIESSAAPGLRERAAGALFGLATGDALGAAIVAPGAPGVWTQHTALALCLADSLVEARDFDARDQMQRFLRWQTEGYMAATPGPQQVSTDVTRALASYRWRGQPMAGSHDPRDLGTASLSRAVVAALIEPDAAAASALAGEASRTTHQSPLVVDACRYVAAMLYGVLRGDPRALVEQPYFPSDDFWDARPLKPEVARLKRVHAPAEQHDDTGARAADALAVIAHVRTAVTGNDRFEGAVRAAVVGTHEPAICGALAGALAGAAHGLRDIPQVMLETLRRRELLDQQLTRILGRRERTLAASSAASRGG
jgi:ADP-ribosylglycohydrolase/protein-tyrosine phosphatase